MLIEGMAALMKAAGPLRRATTIMTVSRILKTIEEKDARFDQEAARSLYELLLKTSEVVDDLNRRIDKARTHLSERRR